MPREDFIVHKFDAFFFLNNKDTTHSMIQRYTKNKSRFIENGLDPEAAAIKNWPCRAAAVVHVMHDLPAAGLNFSCQLSVFVCTLLILVYAMFI